MSFKNYREESKKVWGKNKEGELSHEEIQMGCILRIADATEKMAGNYTTLQNERDRYYQWYKDQAALTVTLHRRISALQGVITKLKKKGK